MSLIQEALKRREEEEAGLIADAEADGPDIIPGPPPREPLGRKESNGRGWVALFSVLLAILILLGAALALLFYVVRSLPDAESRIEMAETLPPEIPGQNSTPGSAQPVGSPERGASAESPGPGQMQAGSEAMPAEDTPSPEQTLAALSVPDVDASRETAPMPAEPETDSPVASEPPSLSYRETPAEQENVPAVETPLASAEQQRSPDAWPELHVTGVLTKGDPDLSTAIINNEIVGVNEQIDGVTILEVESYGVWAEYGDETRYLRVGRKAR